MTIALQSAPSIAAVGVPVVVAVSGASTVARTATTTPEVRVYLLAAPATSKLPTLEQLAELDAYRDGALTSYGGPLPEATRRESLRLEATSSGASFVPDSPGRYVVRAYDVAAYAFLRTFGGAVPNSGELAVTDNELAALPGYAGGLAQAPYVDLEVWAWQEKARRFGVGQATATLTLRTYSDRLVSLDADRVVLTPGPSALSKLAASDRDVRRVLGDWKAIGADLFTSTVVRVDAPLTYSDGNALSHLVTHWSNHLQTDTAYAVHGAVDSANTVAGTAVDLATAIARLNALRAAFNAHVILTAGSVHALADGGSVVATPACSDLQTALDLWRELRAALFVHGTKATSHPTGIGSPAAIDGALGEWSESPQNLAELVDQTEDLGAAYDAHRIKTAVASPHALADADNIVDATGVEWSTISKEAAYQIINSLADAIERHAANLDATSQPTTSYHTHPSAQKIASRASDDTSAAITLELIMVAMEAHAAAAGIDQAHASPVLGLYAPGRTLAGLTWGLAPRLSRAWHYATSSARASVPTNANRSAASLVASGGWT